MATKTQNTNVNANAPVNPVTESFDQPIEKLAGLAELEAATKPFRDAKKPALAVVVFKQESFRDPLTLDQRSYRLQSDTGLEKGDSLAGDDPSVNLRFMLEGTFGYKWQIDYCYIPKKQGFPLSVQYGLETPAHREELGPLFGDSPHRVTAERFRKTYTEKGVPEKILGPFLDDVLSGRYAEAEKARLDAEAEAKAKIKADGKVSDKEAVATAVFNAGMMALKTALPSYRAISDWLVAQFRATQGASTRKAATPEPKAETPAPKAEAPAKAEKPAPKHEKRLPPPAKAKAKAAKAPAKPVPKVKGKPARK